MMRISNVFRFTFIFVSALAISGHMAKTHCAALASAYRDEHIHDAAEIRISSATLLSSLSKIWERKYSADSYAISADGTRAAISIAPECSVLRSNESSQIFVPTNLSDLDGQRRPEKLEYSRTRLDYTAETEYMYHLNGVQCRDSGYLKLLDETGSEIWTYPQGKDSDLVGIYNVSISADGKLIAAELSRKPCRKRKVQVSGTEEPNRPAYKEMLTCNREVALFDEKGKLLWHHAGRGLPKISPTGKYVLVIPFVGSSYNRYVYGYAWQLFNQSGQLLIEEKINTIQDASAVLDLSEDQYTKGPFSADGSRFVLANSLWEDTPSGVKKVQLPALKSGFRIGRLSDDGTSLLSTKGSVLDLSKGEIAGKLPKDMTPDSDDYYPVSFYVGEDYFSVVFPNRGLFSGSSYYGLYRNPSITNTPEPDLPLEEEPGKAGCLAGFNYLSSSVKPELITTDFEVGAVSGLTGGLLHISDNRTGTTCVYDISRKISLGCENTLSVPIGWGNGKGFLVCANSTCSNYRISK